MTSGYLKEFTDEKLNRYLIDFDAVKRKYDINEIKDSHLYEEVLEYERIHRPVDYTRKDTASFIENTNLVYGNNESDSMEFLWQYKTSLDSLLNKYVAIDGLSRLYDERYIEFEWDMHSRMDFSGHTISYYRDHFIHQLRDCYMLLELLDDSNVYNKVYRIMNDITQSKVSKFFCENLQRVLYDFDEKSSYGKLLHKIYLDSKTSGDFNNYVKKIYSKYIITASAIVASLFHDIGYPIVHYFRYQKRLLKFAPSVYMLINGDKSSSEKIAALLSQSLLFQVVGKDEIFSGDDDNHGAFSAIALLLHFYETGLIYSLPAEKKVVIELAALAIYNHTINYQAIKDPERKETYKYDYFCPQFNLNPISFLLRLCDDAQEWERTYFEISSTPTIMYCKNCLTPLKKIKEEKNERYYCKCCNNKKNRYKSFRLKDTEFDRRVIYNVTPSRKLTLCSNLEGYFDSLIFDFNYDLFKLLRMCSVGTTYAKQRTKELNYIKTLVEGQDIGYKNGIFIKFFMSNNPIFIKSYIIKKLIDKVDRKVVELKLDIDVDKIFSIQSDEYKQNFYNSISNYYDGAESRENLVKIITSVSPLGKDLGKLLKNDWCVKQLTFYLLISEIGRKLISYENKSKIEEINLHTDSIAFEVYRLYVNKGGKKSELILKLLKDTLFQYTKMSNWDGVAKSYNDIFYYETMSASDSLIFDVNCYCNVTNDINMYSDSDDGDSFSLDYYSDLYLFELLNSKLKVK